MGRKDEPNTPEQLQLSFGSTFLDIDQVADMMRVPKSFIYRRTAKGHDDPIPNYRLGRHLRFKLEDVEAWIENHRNETPPESPAALVAALRRSARGRSTEARRKLSEPGAVAWMFESKGVAIVTGAAEDDIFLVAADAGAEEVRASEETIEVVTPPGGP